MKGSQTQISQGGQKQIVVKLLRIQRVQAACSIGKFSVQTTEYR